MIQEELARHDRKPEMLPTAQMNASGVVGLTDLVCSARIPIALAGVEGTLLVHVLERDIPFLHPICFCQDQGLWLDLVVLSAARA